jgi:hypothetical protein
MAELSLHFRNLSGSMEVENTNNRWIDQFTETTSDQICEVMKKQDELPVTVDENLAAVPTARKNV